MTSSSKLLVAALVTLITIACSSTPKVDLNEPRRVLGREDDVRIDAQLLADTVGPNSLVGVTYEIQNLRDTPIALVNLSGDASYDVNSRTITVNVGAEIPTEESVQNLVTIPSGGSKSFTTGARVNVHVPLLGPTTPAPRYLRLRVNYLGNVQSVETLIETQSTASVSPDLFPKWIESNEAITTSSVPIAWGQSASMRGMPDVAFGGGAMR